MMEWLGSTLSHRGTAGRRACVCALVVLLTVPAAQAARVPLRPNRHAASRQLQEPVTPRRGGVRRVDELSGTGKQGKANRHGGNKRSAETHTRDKATPKNKAVPRGKGRKAKPAEPDDDMGVELKRAKGRRAKGHATAVAARGPVALGQPRWRVRALPAVPLNGANLAPAPRLATKILPMATANVPVAVGLTPVQEADLEQDLREAGDTPEASAPAAMADGSLLHPTRSQLAEEAELPTVLPGTYRDGRMVVGPLRGSREVLVHQNLMADDAGLERIRNDAQLARLRAAHKLVDFVEGNGLAMNPPLPLNRRCARPWTVRFAADIAKAYSLQFGEPLVVTSAVRTIGYQLRLQRVNGNAAAVDGDGASPHLTGQALDFGKRGMDGERLSWMRAYLLPLMQAGKIDVEEEFQQACFHISVYRSYVPVNGKVLRTEVAQLRGVER